MSVDELKAKGNALFSAGNYDEAIGWFTKAIDAGGNHVLPCQSLYSSHAARHHLPVTSHKSHVPHRHTQTHQLAHRLHAPFLS